MTDMIAPLLGKKGFEVGCSQPGPVRPMLDAVIHEGIQITFTAAGIIFSEAKNAPPTVRQVLEQFSTAIEAVQCRPAHVSSTDPN